MARRKKDGVRTTGIYAKKGNLYIVTSQIIMKDGNRISKKKWIPTKLADTPENVKKAAEMRSNMREAKDFTLNRDMSLSDYIDYYLSTKKDLIADTTYASYFYQAQRIKKYFGKTKIKNITQDLFIQFFDDMFRINHLGVRTAKDTKAFLFGALKLAQNKGLLSVNPIDGIKLKKKLAAEYTIPKNADDEFFSFREANIFLEQAKNNELYSLFYVTIFFGLRKEEVLGLKWSAIDLLHKKLRINHTVTKGTKVNRLNTTKTEYSIRSYPLTDEQIIMFRTLLERESEYKKIFGDCYHDNDYVFKHEDGSLYYPDYPSKGFRKLLKKIPELPQDVLFRNLRNSCVSILVHEGLDVKSIQKWVGHADIDTTLRIYAKVKEKEMKEEVSRSMSERIHLLNN